MPQTRKNISITTLFVFGGLAILSGALSLVSMRFRKATASEPVVLVDAGQVVKANMKKLRLTLTDLLSLLREKGYFNVAEVHYAILEIDGKISVLPKPQHRPVTPLDMGIEPKPGPTGLSRELILDGELMRENLNGSGMTEEQLMAELRRQGVGSVGEVFLASLDPTGVLYVTRGGKREEMPGRYGVE